MYNFLLLDDSQCGDDATAVGIVRTTPQKKNKKNNAQVVGFKVATIVGAGQPGHNERVSAAVSQCQHSVLFIRPCNNAF
jgi:hypothetical protein